MIERLYVHNFRCLENLSLDFLGKPSALLIGKNGAGKSSVRQALQVLQQICRGANRVKNVIGVGDFPWHRKDMPMRFEAGLNLNGKRFEYSISFEWPSSFHEARILGENLTSEGEVVFSRKEAEVSLAGRSTFALDWHVFAMPIINERPPARSIQEVRAFFEGIVILDPIPQQMSGFSKEPLSHLDLHAVDYASCLRALLQQRPKAYSEFEAYITTVMPDFSSIENDDRGKEGGSQLIVTFEQSESRRVHQLNFDALSDGEKCLFLSAYMVAANAVGPPVVCFWDEPDNHLSISEVGHFITGLRRLTNRGGQFIATTHHPETIRKFSDDNTFVLTRKSHLEPTVARLLNSFNYTGDLIHALVRDEIIG